MNGTVTHELVLASDTTYDTLHPTIKFNSIQPLSFNLLLIQYPLPKSDTCASCPPSAPEILLQANNTTQSSPSSHTVTSEMQLVLFNTAFVFWQR
jgi:hypothetical protein